MKGKKVLLSLCLAALVFCFCAFTGPASASAEGASADYAGEYSYVCIRLSARELEQMLQTGREVVEKVRDRYVDAPAYEGSRVTLNADGTGYLYLGEDNQGSFEGWTADGGVLRFTAGVSDFEGTIADGVMTLSFEEGLSLLFAAPDADLSAVKPVSREAFANLVYGIVDGEYTLFAAGYAGQVREAAELGATSEFTLEKGGTGSMSFDEETMDITAWKLDGDTVTIEMADGSSAAGTLRKEYGVIELNFSGYLYYYGQEGADTDAYLKPDSRVYALYDSLDPNAGVHLKYSVHTDYMDATSSFDVHARDGVYYSARTTEVSGYESTSATFFRDGTAYVLDPEKRTSTVATTTTSSLIADNVLMMDQLYSAIYSHARSLDYTVETRELNGMTCSVDVYPATEYQAEASFWFDEAGNLVRYVEGPPVVSAAADIGESDYTVESIDAAVDDSLFDISAYQPAG